MNTPSDTICVFIMLFFMLLFTIRYYTNIINVQPTAFNFPLYFVFIILFKKIKNTYPLSNLIRSRCAERAKPGRVLIMNIGFFACFQAISLEHSRFSEISTFFNALVATEAVGIAHKSPRSLWCENSR